MACCLNKEKKETKSNEILKKNFSYDKSKVLNKLYINNSFPINKEILTSNEELKKLAKNKNQNKAIIVKKGINFLLSEKITINYSLSISFLNKKEDLGNISTFKTESIQDISYPKEWSISSLNVFFMKSIKETRELPLFAISAKLNNNNLDKTEKLYIKLLDLYENTPETDDLFIGELILTFNDQFTKMANNLLNSNIMFKEGVLPKIKSNPTKKGEINKQYIISPKEIIVIEFIENQWETNKTNINHNNTKTKIDQNQYIQTNFNVSTSNIRGVNDDMLKQKEKLKKEEEERKKREQKNY